MLSRLISNGSRGRKKPAVPDGRLIYAIGDVHGRLDCLDGLLTKIFADERDQNAIGSLIFLGDLIDRGPDSAGVICRVIELCEARNNSRVIGGNHEQLLREALDGNIKSLRLFMQVGGIPTAHSYGVSLDAYYNGDLLVFLETLRAAVPPQHRSFLENLEGMIIEGDYAFVHAGVRPGVPFKAQRELDLRWIRNEFLSYRKDLEKTVVHGHTIVDQVEELSNRVAIDTGAWRTGVLTAMGFSGEDRWIIQEKVFAAI